MKKEISMKIHKIVQHKQQSKFANQNSWSLVYRICANGNQGLDNFSGFKESSKHAPRNFLVGIDDCKLDVTGNSIIYHPVS